MAETSLDLTLPESSILFYRSRFEILPEKNCRTDIWPQIIRVLQDWLESKEDRRKMKGQQNLYEHLTKDVINYSLLLGTSNQDCYLSEALAKGTLVCECGSLRLETKSVKGTGTNLLPQFWAFDYIEQDTDKPFRKWRTNVGITLSAAGACVVNIRVAIYDDATYMGQAQIPERNTPNFISNLLDLNDCTTNAGGIPLSSQPIAICKENFDEFISNLKSSSRVTPIIVVSAFWGEDRSVFDIDPQAFAKKVAGSAIVYTLDRIDDELRDLYRNFFLNQEDTRKFRIPNGGVRVFLPEVDFDNASDSVRHRFYAHNFLQDRNLEEISDNICIGISRLYQQRRDEVVSPSDVRAQENKIKREYYATKYREARKERDALAHSPLLRVSDSSDANLKEENTALWQELERAESDNAFMQEYIDLLESSADDETNSFQERINECQLENRQLSSNISRLRYDIANLRDENEHQQQKLLALKNQIDSWESISAFPSTPLEAVQFAKCLYGDRIIFLEEAMKSADDFIGDENEVFQIIKCMHHHLWPLLFDEDQAGSIDLEEEFKRRSGFELALNESRTTQNAQRFMRLRIRKYQNQDIDITPHVKGTSGKRDATLRVHYWKDDVNKMLVIGHCGEHLETAGTRHKK